jgi:hypothetical protein
MVFYCLGPRELIRVVISQVGLACCWTGVSLALQHGDIQSSSLILLFPPPILACSVNPFRTMLVNIS